MKTTDDNSISKMVFDDWQAGRRRMHSFIEKCKQWDRQWDGIMPSKDFPWKNCSNLNVPITSSIGDTLLAYLSRNLLGHRPLLRVKPRGDTPVRNAQIMEAVIDDQAYNDSSLFQALVEAFHDGLRYGVWAVIVDWEEDETHIPSRVAVPVVDESGELTGFEEHRQLRIKKISRPKIIAQNITQIVVSPQATCINKDGVGHPADYVIFRRFFNMDTLSRHSADRGGVYFNLDKLEPNKNSCVLDEVLREKEERLGVGRNMLANDELEGLEGWYWYDLDGDGKKELCVFTVIITDGKPVLIRKQECPYRHYKIPLVWQKLFPERGLYSRSVPAWLKDIQDEINTIHNQRRDAVSLSLLKMWKYRLGSRFDVNQELFPGCMIGVLDMQDFEPVTAYEQGIIPAINEEQLLNAYVERMTGINDYTLGRESENTTRATATGTLAMMHNANLRIDLIVNYWRNCGLRELGEFLGELNKQFYPVENKIEPFNPKAFLSGDLDQGMLHILISDIEGDFHYEYTGTNSFIDQVAQRQQAVFLYDILQNNPFIREHPQSLYDLTADLLRTYGKNDVYLPSPAQIETDTFEKIKQAVKELSIENRISAIRQIKDIISAQETPLQTPAGDISPTV